MKDYKKRIYSINKNSENIVYMSQKSGAIQLTLEQFLASDPKLTKDDFEYWKNWSDENYKEEDLLEERIARKNVSYENMIEVFDFLGTTLEEEFENREMERLQKAAIAYAKFQFYSDIRVSDKTVRRCDAYFNEGKTKTQIAKDENVTEMAVRKSIKAGRAYLIKQCLKYMKDYM